MDSTTELNQKLESMTQQNSSITQKRATSDCCPACKGKGGYLKWLHVAKVNRDYEYWIEPCDVCGASSIEKKTTHHQNDTVPYKSFLTALNPSAYVKDGQVIDMSKKYDFVTRYIENFKYIQDVKNGIYIHSSIKGTGKTFLASIIANEVRNRYGTSVLFLSETRLLDICERGEDGKYDKNGYNEKPIDKIKRVQLLIIDDLGQKKTGSDYLDDVLFDVIDKRMVDKRPTIFTSNYNIRELMDKKDSRLVDRINRMCVTVELPNVDLRALEVNKENAEYMRRLGY